MTGLPQNPETYSVLGTFDSWSPPELAGRRLFGNDQGLMYVELHGPMNLEAVLNWHIAGHIEWADDVAKERVLSTARAELSAALRYRSLSTARSNSAPVALGPQDRRPGSSGQLNNTLARLALMAFFMAIALSIVSQANRLTEQARFRTAEAEQASQAAYAQQDSRKENYVADALAKLPPPKDAWAERDFLRISREKFKNDPAAIARIEQIKRVDRPSTDVLDIYTMGYPPDLRPIVSATLPDIFKDKAMVVNVRNAINQDLDERITIQPGRSTMNITFPPPGP